MAIELMDNFPLAQEMQDRLLKQVKSDTDSLITNYIKELAEQATYEN